MLKRLGFFPIPISPSPQNPSFPTLYLLRSRSPVLHHLVFLGKVHCSSPYPDMEFVLCSAFIPSSSEFLCELLFSFTSEDLNQMSTSASSDTASPGNVQNRPTPQNTTQPSSKTQPRMFLLDAFLSITASISLFTS